MSRELIQVERAREIVLDAVRPLPSEPIGLAEALGRVLAEEIVAAEAVPAFDNSAMDGFAVRSEDTAGAKQGSAVRLEVIGESSAGHPAVVAMRPGATIRISTGAQLPEGADSIIRIEEVWVPDTDQDPYSPDLAAIETDVFAAPGRDIRRAGEDIAAGQTVLRSGAVIGPPELGVIASAGCPEVICSRRPRVAVVTTGDELLDPGEPMRPGGVRNTNAWCVPAMARLAGAEALAPGHAPDDPVATRAALAAALEADVVVVCGGVSVGTHDHVRPALAELGVEERFWGVALRPGKPTMFGVQGDGPANGGALVFGLPGNPVSAIVTFILFVRPALRALAGADPGVDRATAILDSGYTKPDPRRTEAARCRLELRDDGWHAKLTRDDQGSHVLTSMLGAEALAMLPAGVEAILPGGRVEIEHLPAAVSSH